MNEREQLLNKIATFDIAIAEWNLFLDTHPNDTEVNKKLDDYKLKSGALKSEFEKKYGPLKSTTRESNRWAWIPDPWPWDITEGD